MTKSTQNNPVESAPEATPELKYDLACGQIKREGFLGVDLYAEEADIKCDLLKFPWKFAKANSVDELHCNHFFEHIPALLRPRFMDECYRILKIGAKLTIVCPYATSSRAIQDFTHAWPPVISDSFYYFNKKWRTENKLTHGPYDMKCDFDFTTGASMDDDMAARGEQFQRFASRYYNNSFLDLFVTLVKRDPKAKD